MLLSTYVRARRQQYDGVDMYYIDTYDEVIHSSNDQSHIVEEESIILINSHKNC